MHGSWWSYVLGGRIADRNPFNEVEPVAAKYQHGNHCQVDMPNPRWSVGRFNTYLRDKCNDFEDNLIHSVRNCIACFTPVPSISTNSHGLCPIFHYDIFGIKGVPGYQQWIIDSGATSSCTNDLSLFSKFSYNAPFKRIRVANGKYAEVRGIGDVVIHVADSVSGTTIKIKLRNVLYIPEVPVNLISTRSLWNDSKIASTFTDVCTLRFKNGTSITFDSGKDGHYYCVSKLPGSSPSPESSDLCTTCTTDGIDASVYATADSPNLSADVVHARLGHCGPDRAVEALHRSIGLPDAPHYRKQLSKICEGCRLGGARKRPLHDIPEQHRPQAFGDRIHSDLCGPFPVSVSGNFKYILSFVDSATGYGEIYFLQSKLADEVKPHFQTFVNKWKYKLPDGVVREWFTDNGGEFTSHDISEFCDEFVTKRGFTMPYCSPQNAQAERLWGILQRSVRILLAHSGMPTSFWHYAAKHSMEIHNMLPRHSNRDHISPHEAVFGTMPDFSHIRVWGCVAYCTLRNEADRENRVSPTGVKAACLGRDHHRRGWLVYIPSLNRITTSRDITFDEQRFLRFDQHGKVIDDTEKFIEDDSPRLLDPVRVYNDTLQPGSWRNLHDPWTKDHYIQQQLRENPPRDATNTGPGYSHADESSTHWSARQCSNKNCTIPSVNGRHAGPCSFERIGGDSGPPSQRTRTRAVAVTQPDGSVSVATTDPYGIFFSVPSNVTSSETEDHSDHTWGINVERLGEIPVPNSYEEAMASRFAHKWKEAMQREIQELLGRGTWESVDVPSGRRPTKSRWVFAVKYLSDGTVERFKARFVVCGYSQVHGVDYEQCFSSTMRGTTFRTLLSLAAHDGLKAEHIDISNAFCQADIDGADIWVQPPRGFEHLCGSGQALKLVKALYGTKQASYLWQQTLSKWLTSQGFVRLKTDPCVFIKGTGTQRVIVGCYVDDLIVLHDATTDAFSQFKTSFLRQHGGRFDGKHIGALEWFLGVKVDQRADGTIHINQSKYINDLLNKFLPNSDAYAYSRDLPYPESSFKSLTEASSDSEIERVKKLPYLQLVGSLLYLCTMSRPDISYYLGVLCSFMHNPSMQCFEAAQSILLYCGRTRHLSIRYSRTFAVPDCLSEHASTIRSQFGFYGFSDSTWTVPKSTCGYVVFLAGGPVAWSSRKLNVVADSSALAEYSATSATSKEYSFIRNLLGELCATVKGTAVLAVDNKAAITISEQRGVTKLTKHFDFAAHRIRDEVEHLRLRCFHVSTNDQVADIFTKPLGEQVFHRHRRRLFCM